MASSTRVAFRVLGPLEVLVAGRPVGLGSPKERALLVLLLLRGNEAVPVERLIDELWPENPPSSARHAVQVYVSRLRRSLGEPERITARSRAYSLRVEADEVDLARFRALLEQGRSTLASEAPEQAREPLSEALALWRGHPLADLDGEPGVRNLVQALQEERLEAQELRIEADLASGRNAELVAELEGLIAQYPARESLYRQLMLALYRSGRQADALQTFRQAREALLHELGLEPNAQLKELEAAILRQDPALTVEPPELRARRHLPSPPNALIGRERELDEVVQLLASGGVRLIALTGTGGIGKTRLALAAAERLAASFADGVWFVDLAPLLDFELVPAAIAQALGVEEKPGQSLVATLGEHVHDKELLLVADNFEHVLDAAPTLSALLKEASRLKVLVTSRAALDLYGEHNYEVPSLELPDLASGLEPDALDRIESVRLFLDRARAVRRDFTLKSADTARIVAETCVRLDGLPLAIELAAARLRTLGLVELLAGLAAQLETLTQATRDVPDRHRTLRAALDWSYGLLAEQEQEVFRRLSVFAGGCTLEAAAGVVGADRDTLRSLVEQSLLRQTDEGRLLMLETVRDYAGERLDDKAAEPLRDAHAWWYAERSASIARRVRAYDVHAMAESDDELANVRVGLARAMEDSNAELLGLYLFGIWCPWGFRGKAREARVAVNRWLECDRESMDGLLRWGALIGASEILRFMGEFDRARELKLELIELARAERQSIFYDWPVGTSIAATLSDISSMDLGQGRLDDALSRAEEALALRIEEGSGPRGARGDTAAVARGIAHAQAALADVHVARGNLPLALHLSEEAASTFRAGGAEGDALLPELGAALVEIELGSTDAARIRVASVLDDLARHSNYVAVLSFALETASVIATRVGHFETAAQLVGAVDRLSAESGFLILDAQGPILERRRAELEASLARDAFVRALETGAELDESSLFEILRRLVEEPVRVPSDPRRN